MGKNYCKLNENLHRDPYYGIPECLRNKGPEVTPTKKEPPKVPSKTQTKTTNTLNVDKTGTKSTINDLPEEDKQHPKFSLPKRKAKSV